MEPEEATFETRMKELAEQVGKMDSTEIAALIQSFRDERAADRATRQGAIDLLHQWQLVACKSCKADTAHGACDACTWAVYYKRLLDALNYSTDLNIVCELAELKRHGGIEKLISEIAEWKIRCKYLENCNDSMADTLSLLDTERAEFPNGWPRRTDGTMLLIGDKIIPDENWEPMTVTGVEVYDDHFCVMLNGYFIYRYQKNDEVLVPQGQYTDRNGVVLEKGDKVTTSDGVTAEIEFLVMSMDHAYRRTPEAFLRECPGFDMWSEKCSDIEKVENDDEEA